MWKIMLIVLLCASYCFSRYVSEGRHPYYYHGCGNNQFFKHPWYPHAFLQRSPFDPRRFQTLFCPTFLTFDLRICACIFPALIPPPHAITGNGAESKELPPYAATSQPDDNSVGYGEKQQL